MLDLTSLKDEFAFLNVVKKRNWRLISPLVIHVPFVLEIGFFENANNNDKRDWNEGSKGWIGWNFWETLQDSIEYVEQIDHFPELDEQSKG